jgi:DNA (cytosine-5)-methyltransferase 1
MRIGSLCSGYGGLDLAALQLFPGSSIAWHCEYDPAPSKILEHHWPDVPNYRDITSLDFDSLPEIDILTAGYPCQPFSAAGRRKGTDDERHLWPYVRAAIRHLRPRFTLLENVAGHRNLGFDRVLGDCAEDGLHVRWCSVRASDVGACHRRERLFILVTDPARDGFARLDEGRERVATGNAGRATLPVDGRLFPTPRASDGTNGGPNQRGSSGDLMLPSAVVQLLPTPSVADGSGRHLTRSGARSDELLLPGVAKAYGEGALLPTPVANDSHPASPADLARNSPGLRAIDGLLPTPNAADSTGGGQHLDKRVGNSRQLIDYALLEGSSRWGAYESAIRRQEALSRPAPSPTEPNTKGKPRLAASFAEWMMFLPEGWVTSPEIGLTRPEQLKAIGNGVVPPQAVAAFRYLMSLSEVAA